VCPRTQRIFLFGLGCVSSLEKLIFMLGSRSKKKKNLQNAVIDTDMLVPSRNLSYEVQTDSNKYKLMSLEFCGSGKLLMLCM